VRLGLLIYGSLDTVSGGFLYDRKLVRYLEEQGDRVEVISLPWRPYALSLLDNLNPSRRQRLSRLRVDLWLQDELVHPAAFLLNRWLRRHFNGPLVAMVHHLRSREARPDWQNRFYAAVEKLYLGTFDAFVCVSQNTRADVAGLVGTGRPSLVAYPGGDRLPGTRTPGEIGARARSAGPLHIIAVANLIPRKQVHTLIQALAGLPRNDWRLTVAGSLTLDPGYVRAIRLQITRENLGAHVELLGHLADADLAARLAASQVLAVPSAYEGLGIVYLEAMRFGLPVIASTAGAAREIIDHGREGFLVPPGDAETLARSLRLLMQDRELLAEMSLAAKQRAAIHPTWRDSLASVQQFLHQVGQGRGGESSLIQDSSLGAARGWG